MGKVVLAIMMRMVAFIDLQARRQCGQEAMMIESSQVSMHRQYKVALLALVALAFAAFVAHDVSAAGASPSSKDATQTNTDIYGRWRIAKVVGAADIAAMSDRQARTLIGKTVDIGEDAFVFDGERCETPSYERAREDLVKSFREQAHASAAGMGLPDPVTSIDAGCTHIFLKRPASSCCTGTGSISMRSGRSDERGAA